MTNPLFDQFGNVVGQTNIPLPSGGIGPDWVPTGGDGPGCLPSIKGCLIGIGAFFGFAGVCMLGSFNSLATWLSSRPVLYFYASSGLSFFSSRKLNFIGVPVRSYVSRIMCSRYRL